jgi:uncharacterized ParB-like nuclease family protein
MTRSTTEMNWKQFNYLFLDPVDVLQAQKRAATLFIAFSTCGLLGLHCARMALHKDDTLDDRNELETVQLFIFGP